MNYARFGADGVLIARYVSAVHGPMPATGFVELSDELFQRTMLETDGEWYLSENGVAKRTVRLTLEQRQECERLWRDDEVTASDWLVNRHREEQDIQLPTTLKADQFSELLLHRQALRDWPTAVAFPDSERRPVAPSWIAEQIK